MSRTMTADNHVMRRSASLEVLEFHSYEAVRGFWIELNRSYRNGELVLDWEAHKLIWDNFYKIRGAKLKILVAFENRRCLGIAPFIWNDNDPTDPPRWSFSEDFLIAREYFCSPDRIQEFAGHFPPHFSDDLSCFYIPGNIDGFSTASGGIIDLKSSQEEYFESLKHKSRHSLKQTAQINADISVEPDTKVRWDEIQGVLKQQLNYWSRKNGIISEQYVQYTMDKIRTELLLMMRAQEIGRLVALYFYLDGELVAANFSVRRDSDRVDDYLCLRNCDDDFAHRGLGIFAILKNMEHCRNLGIRYYDMSSCIQTYKRKFLNMESFYYHIPFDDPGQNAHPSMQDPSSSSIASTEVTI